MPPRVLGLPGPVSGSTQDVGARLPFSNIITVDQNDVAADYDTIQAALSAAASGDVILIGPGTYTEQLVMPAVDVTLVAMGAVGPVATGGKVIVEQTFTTETDTGVVELSATGSATFIGIEFSLIHNGNGTHRVVEVPSGTNTKTHIFRSCHFHADASGSFGGNMYGVRVAQGNTNIELHDCSFETTNGGVDDDKQLIAQGPASTATVLAVNCRFDSDAQWTNVNSCFLTLMNCEVLGTFDGNAGNVFMDTSCHFATLTGSVSNRSFEAGANYAIKQPVRLATAAVLPANTSSGSGTGKRLTAVSNGALSVDGSSVNTDDRILVKNEATGSDNGIYFVVNPGGGSVQYVLERANDFDGAPGGEVMGGVLISAQEGTANADSVWQVTTDDPITVDTTTLTFTSVGGGSGDVVGPASATDNAIARFDTTTGKLIQNSGVTINDTDQVAAMETATFKPEHDNGNQGASWTLNWNNGQKQRVTLTASTTTLTITAPPGPGNFLLKVIQGGVGNFGITWPAGVLWPNGNAPNFTNASGSEDIVTFYYDGTNYYGVATLDFQ